MYNNSFRNIITPLLISLGVVVGILLGVYIGRGRALRMAPAQGGMPVSGVSADKLSYTLSLIENLYVDSVNMDSIAEHVFARRARSSLHIHIGSGYAFG